MSLQTLLGQQQNRLESLITLLQREQSLLSEGSVDGAELRHVADQKHALFSELESSEAARRSVQQRLGYPLTPEGALQAATDAHCAEQWDTTLAMTEQVAQLNALNGELIQHRLQHNQHMLNLLRDAAGSSLYGPDGQANKQRQRVNSRA
ncbi:flagella synthesis protein FlgN [Aliidiomarina sanyensis]|uniref:Flagellar protein FlgN n=1 Tax=Aliidiomarina sanyensis TaxID=1249555 RepID=A0A432WPV7_9GAMM|nr:flagellar protein FlgN [Aliidiomarina sanyensis]RUO35840.1 flagellar protein FlgN [Aliidiomarina sanyensis]